MTTASSSRPRLTVSTRTSLRAVYLHRVERLQRLRSKHARELNPRGLRLLDRALFAAYCACRDIGIEAEARSALRGEPANDLPSASTHEPSPTDC